MEDVRKALAVSIGSRAFSALLGLVALPLYVQFLGVEGYGVVGLFATLQVLVAFMDLGLTTTLTRELAGVGHDGEKLAHARSVALTFERAYLAVAGVIGLLLAALAPLVASRWVKLDALSAGQVTNALQLAGLALACQWPSNLYSAGLAGLHRQTALAVSSSAFAAFRVVLSVWALWQKPTLEAFFLAQIASAVVQSAGTRIQLWQALRLPGHRAAARMELLHRSRVFAGGMTAITVTSILLVQMDKVILSYLLPLPEFGVYVVASSLAMGLYILISPVFSVIYPRLSGLWNAGDLGASIGLYHASSQAMAALILPLAAVLVFFPAQALFTLTGNRELSDQGAWVLVFLAIGSATNGIMNIPYALQLAAGWTSLSVWLNLIALAVLAPATWLAATRWGAAGGAAVWAALNLGYLLVTPQVLHRRLIPGEKWRWYLQDVLHPALVCVAVVLLLGVLAQPVQSRWLGALQLASYWLAAVLATVLAIVPLRQQVARVIWR